jgi:hypothetical protein
LKNITETVYAIFSKIDHVSYCTIDGTKAASLIGIHKNTLKNRLRKYNDYYEDHKFIIAKAILYKTNRGRIPFTDKKLGSKNKYNEQI